MEHPKVLPLRLAEMVYPPSHPMHGWPGVVYGYAILTIRGAVLVDTGIGPAHPDVDPDYRPTRADLLGILSEHGIERSGILAIVNTHLHFDHCGGNPLFPGTPIYVQREERAAAREVGYTIPEWVDYPGVKFKEVEGDHLLIDGVNLLATPGHTPGHQSVAVNTKEGTVLLAGQAVAGPEEWLGRDPLSSSSPAGFRSAEQLRKLAPRLVYFSHYDEPLELD